MQLPARARHVLPSNSLSVWGTPEVGATAAWATFPAARTLGVLQATLARKFRLQESKAEKREEPVSVSVFWWTQPNNRYQLKKIQRRVNNPILTVKHAQPSPGESRQLVHAKPCTSAVKCFPPVAQAEKRTDSLCGCGSKIGEPQNGALVSRNKD